MHAAMSDELGKKQYKQEINNKIVYDLIATKTAK